MLCAFTVTAEGSLCPWYLREVAEKAELDQSPKGRQGVGPSEFPGSTFLIPPTPWSLHPSSRLLPVTKPGEEVRGLSPGWPAPR